MRLSRQVRHVSLEGEKCFSGGRPGVYVEAGPPGLSKPGPSDLVDGKSSRQREIGGSAALRAGQAQHGATLGRAGDHHPCGGARIRFLGEGRERVDKVQGVGATAIIGTNPIVDCDQTKGGLCFLLTPSGQGRDRGRWA